MGKGGRRNGEELEEEEEGRSWIDVVAVSHEFTDHCHRETLLEVHPDVPVVAAKVCLRHVEAALLYLLSKGFANGTRKQPT